MMNQLLLLVSILCLFGCTDPAQGVCRQASDSRCGLGSSDLAPPDLPDPLDGGAAADLGAAAPQGLCSIDHWCWQYPLPYGFTLLRLWGTSASDIWAVGTPGVIIHWDGRHWESKTNGMPQILQAIWGSDANNIWVVGFYGTILKWTGSVWLPQDSGTSQPLVGVWGTDANNVWAVGSAGTILKWDGTTWTAQDSHTTQTIRSVWGTDPNNVWAVGQAGTILKWNGTLWTPQPSGTTQPFNYVWGTDASNIWMVGYQGTILKGDYDPPIRTYTDARMEMSCRLPGSPT